jgi:MFS family permease
MGFGILEPAQPVVPGTIQLFDSVTNVESTAHLKHSADGKTILAPQPSNSPNDPLNWSTLKKDGVFAMLLLGAILAGVHGPVIAPVTLELATEFDKDLNAIAQLSSYMLLVLAGTAFIDSALAHIYGKRAIFIFSMAILVAADAWASKANSYGSLLGARILSGAGQAAYECLSSSVVADLYFVHQRSKRVGIFVLLFGTGVYLGVPIGTQVIQASSWRWAFGGLAISEGIILLLLILFFHEPVYKREHVDPLANMTEEAVFEKMGETVDVHENSSTVIEDSEKPKSFAQNLNIYGGRYSQNNFFSLLYRVVLLTLHPAVLWVSTSGLILSWPVGISYTAAAFLTLPPYNFGPQGVANMYLGGWIGMLLALFIGTPLFGWIVRRTAHANRSVYEPEFLLYQVIPGIIICVIGMVGWGWAEQDQLPWGGLIVFFAMFNGGAVMYNNAAIAYVLDAHREYANESQVAIFAIKVFIE